MNIERLTNYDFPEDMIAGWRKLGMNELQPIQAQAILKYKLFNGNSMIVSAPTSSGKTFVGELALPESQHPGTGVHDYTRHGCQSAN